MNKTQYIYAFIIFCCSSLSGTGQPAPTIQHRIDKCVQGYYQDKKFNGTVLIAKRGNIIYQKGFGYAALDAKKKNDVNTKFLIGSTTKSFTAIAVMQCLERGLLELHTPISNYLTGLNKAVGQLTLHQLMKNASGLPVHLNRITQLEYRDISSKALIDLYRKVELSFSPGSQFEYSNLNYQLCALVVESVSGLSYPAYMNQYVFRPLGMDQSGVQRTHDHIQNRAIGYDLKDGTLIPATKNYLSYAMGGEDIYANVLDLLKWDQALYHEELLTQKSTELLFDGKPGVFGGYGYGFKIKTYDRQSKKEGKLVRHGGSMFGFVCNVHRYLDDEVTIIILGNMRPYPVMKITTEIEKILFGNPTSSS